jgi:hypothetical protein
VDNKVKNLCFSSSVDNMCTDNAYMETVCFLTIQNVIGAGEGVGLEVGMVAIWPCLLAK